MLRRTVKQSAGETPRKMPYRWRKETGMQNSLPVCRENDKRTSRQYRAQLLRYKWMNLAKKDEIVMVPVIRMVYEYLGSGGIEKSHSCKWAKWIQWHALPHIQQSTQQRNKGHNPNLHGWDFSIPPSPILRGSWQVKKGHQCCGAC